MKAVYVRVKISAADGVRVPMHTCKDHYHFLTGDPKKWDGTIDRVPEDIDIDCLFCKALKHA
jgi:hypothetical protein